MWKNDIAPEKLRLRNYVNVELFGKDGEFDMGRTKKLPNKVKEIKNIDNEKGNGSLEQKVII